MRALVRAIAALWATVPSAGAQSACRLPDYIGNLAEQRIAQIVSNSRFDGPAYRDSLRLPASPASAVVRVTEEQLCIRGQAAYAAYWSGQGGTTVSQAVYVWRVGDRYVIYDPDYRYRPRGGTYALVVDLDFRPLSIFGDVQFVQ